MTKVFIAGHNGMVGSAIYRWLAKKKKFTLSVIDKQKLDLTNQAKVINFFKKKKI